MKELLPEAKAKMAPFLVDVKEHVKPLGHAAVYLASCVSWLCLLPFVLLGTCFQHVAASIKPELKKPEPELEKEVGPV